jgi:hypothetical protein
VPSESLEACGGADYGDRAGCRFRDVPTISGDPRRQTGRGHFEEREVVRIGQRVLKRGCEDRDCVPPEERILHFLSCPAERGKGHSGSSSATLSARRDATSVMMP